MRCFFAPMEGITGALFRRTHRRFFPGVDRYFMPFLSPSQHHVFTRRELRDILPEQDGDLDAVPQLLTRSGADFLWAAGELARMGYREVNLNLGCPSGTVTAKGKGAGMLGRPEELDHLLEDIFSASPLPSLSRPVWVSRTRRSSGPSWTSTTSIPSPSSLSTPGCGRTCTAAPPGRSCSPPSWPPAAPPCATTETW